MNSESVCFGLRPSLEIPKTGCTMKGRWRPTLDRAAVLQALSSRLTMLTITVVLRMLREEVSSKIPHSRITSSAVATNEFTNPRVYFGMIFLFDSGLVRSFVPHIRGVIVSIVRERTCHNSRFLVGTLHGGIITRFSGLGCINLRI